MEQESSQVLRRASQEGEKTLGQPEMREIEMVATQQDRETKLEREMRALGLQLGGYEMGGFMRIVSSVGAAHYERILARKRQQITEVRP